MKIFIASLGILLLSGSSRPDSDSQGRVFMTLARALEKFFPKCEIERTTAYLNEARRAEVTKLSGQPLDRGIVFPYVARKGGKVVGTAYLDTDRVRSLRQTLMVIVSPEGTIARIELLAFAEPKEYIPRGNWYDQFKRQKLDPELNLRRGIDGITGATLTARATVRAARRVLAIHEVIAKAP